MLLKVVTNLVLRWRLVLLLTLVTVVLLATQQHTLLSSSSTARARGTVHTAVLLNTTAPEGITAYEHRLPRAIIIGVRKAGTRALLDMLALHPSIVSAKAEVHFFDKDDNYHRGVQWYINGMPPSLPHQVIVEKTPAYFVGPKVPYRIFKTCPNVKLLLIVRNPIDRTISDYAQLNTKKRLSLSPKNVSFEQVVFEKGQVNMHYNPVTVSLYSKHFMLWLNYFKLSQILVVDGDALIHHPLTELQRAESFLGVENYFTEKMFYFNETKGFYCWQRNGKSHCLGNGKGREHPTVNTQSLQTLDKFFKPHNEEFFNLTGLRFNW